MNAYTLEAIHLMGLAKMPVTESDTCILSADIKAVADEDEDNAFSPDSELAYRAAMTLKHRIGGVGNLESYMKCLRVGASKQLNC